MDVLEVGMVETGTSILVDVVGKISTADAIRLWAAARPSAICSSDTGFSSALQPACIGARRPDSTLRRPSAHDNTMHDSTNSRRPSLAALHMPFW